MTGVYITESAKKIILEEVRYFAKQGNKEAIVYPMFGFARATECMKAPWEMLELDDIEYFLITHAHPPLREFCTHSAFRAKYVFTNEEQRKIFQDDIDQWSKSLALLFPALELGNVHSHPFSYYWTQPSNGSKEMDYHRIYRLWEHMCSRKVNTPLEVILCKNFWFGSWVMCCFGFDQQQKIVTFGRAKMISDNDKRVLDILVTPYYATEKGMQWEASERKKCPEIEAIDRFYFGWSSIRLKISDMVYAFVNLPLQFPNTDSLLINTLNTKTRTWGKMQKYYLCNMGYNFSLNEIVKKIQEGGLNE